MGQNANATKQSRIEKRAQSITTKVAAEVDLTDEQQQQLKSALQAKFEHNSSNLNDKMSDDDKQELWRAGNRIQQELLAEHFEPSEVKQINKAVRAIAKAGQLFNGRDLDGWEQVNGTATYEVVDGAIVGTTVAGSPNSFLATKKSYANFDLQFQVFLVDNELNSGVQFRSAQHDEQSLASVDKKHPVGRVYGYQCEIEASADGDMDPEHYGDAGYIYDEARRGWLIDDETRLTASTRGAFKNQEWNRMRIRCEGDHIQTWINGQKITDFHDDMTASGFIALQVHGIGKKDAKWQVKWRNITINELP
ncbi:3-keto-disaccharide hydrolase [Rubripirellula amarantea]|uniref:3-keto-disaccharide hydrolase n=1 Tax=Rubripirellula amarantea TaxID=2527999 RepID=UPI0013EF04A3|nr:DUF1080 domain-containing protein [Rubripirellula amarantea]